MGILKVRTALALRGEAPGFFGMPQFLKQYLSILGEDSTQPIPSQILCYENLCKEYGL
mgnify:FL=1|jgi:hypothetical protein